MNKNPNIYIYPKLPAKYTFLIRFFGSGLANCLFVYARAVLLSDKLKISLISPQWIQFNIGPYLRNEPDKRHYHNLFENKGISGIRKYWLLTFKKRYQELDGNIQSVSGIIVVEGLKKYFIDLHTHNELIKSKIIAILKPKWLNGYNEIEKNSIGIHIRLGDYGYDNRIQLHWYLKMMDIILELASKPIVFNVFSDGTLKELESVLKYPNTKYLNYGSAISDILALSQTKLIIASDSTFSAWAAYLGQVPILFLHRHFGQVLDNPEKEFVQGESSVEDVKTWLSNLKLEL